MRWGQAIYDSKGQKEAFGQNRFRNFGLEDICNGLRPLSLLLHIDIYLSVSDSARRKYYRLYILWE